MIKVSELSVSLSGREILNDISLTIQEGKWSCLVGPNGAGKTTFLKVLLGTASYSGSVTVNGS